MKTHDKISFVREYCNCRRIPYSIKNEQLFIEGYYVCFSLFNLTYIDIIKMIDDICEYDIITTFFVRRKEVN